MAVQPRTAAQSGRAATNNRAAPRSVRCLICGRAVSDGLRIRGETICRQCEARLVSARVDSPSYEHYLRRLRRLWPESPVDE